MVNDYKQDVGKVPLLAALQPFAPALYALARMMDDMQHKHRLAGSADPFNQWAQLPEAKVRMAQALERHLLPEEGTLWDVNTKDGQHLHATHGLFNLLGSLTLHLRELARVKGQDTLRELAAQPVPPSEFDSGVLCLCGHRKEDHASPGLPTYRGACRHAPRAAPLSTCPCMKFCWDKKPAPVKHGDRVLSANEAGELPLRGQYWTGDHGTWLCTCGAGRPEACTCDQSKGGVGIGL